MLEGVGSREELDLRKHYGSTLYGAISSPRGQAAVDHEFSAGDETGFVGQQIDAHLRHFTRLAEPAERNVPGQMPARDVGPPGLRENVVDHRSLEERRMHRVAA